ncbi:MAG: hypothetical protein V3R99_10305, partial [Thermoguttaceae bacterium]
MSDTFDPYQVWLRIAPQEQPPNHYRLLGLDPFETDVQNIQRAATRRMGSLQEHLTGEHAEIALRILNEIAAAKACLSKVEEKAAYDAQLRQSSPSVAEDRAKQAAAKAQRDRCDRFLTVLREKDLLPTKLVEDLRRQVGQSKKAVTAVAVAERLIKAGHLTPVLAKRLLASIGPAEAQPAESRPASQPSTTAQASEDDDLGMELLPLDDEPKTKAPKSRPATSKPTPSQPTPPADEDDLGLDLIPLDDEPKTKAPRSRPASSKPATP